MSVPVDTGSSSLKSDKFGNALEDKTHYETTALVNKSMFPVHKSARLTINDVTNEPTNYGNNTIVKSCNVNDGLKTTFPLLTLPIFPAL